MSNAPLLSDGFSWSPTESATLVTVPTPSAPPQSASEASHDASPRNNGATELEQLLAGASTPLPPERLSRLLHARLGVASSLFIALRCKHAESAAHSIRVALNCSLWAADMGMPLEDRHALEVAALLHDIGKIGVPDRILLKPAKLTEEEQAIVELHRLMGVEILSACCGSLKVLEIVSNAPAWYNGRRLKLDAEGDAIPLGARMLAIADAYDSMTNSQIYRPARSHERAIQELFECAGAQFDPNLVQKFADLYLRDRSNWPQQVESAWLKELDPTTVNLFWQLNHSATGSVGPAGPNQLFLQRLLENMYDAVVFVDPNRQIMLWNRSAERLTGIASSIAYQRIFDFELLHIRNERGEPCTMDECPITIALRTSMQSMRRLLIRGYDGRDVIIDVQAIPVVSESGALRGVAAVMRDASGQISLEERCINLQQQATRDPLTQLANRAEFDRVHAMFVDVHLERNLPCSLIITDIDRFKLVNDTYGHQAGDEAIKSIAQLLKANCRAGDLAARYGGEEFVVLCANCNNATATQRAEEMRRAFHSLPQNSMGGACLSASFGVTEIQPGDTPETMLRRADRALLQAKDTGRNKVVQLGGGIGEPLPERRRRWWWPWGSEVSSLELASTWITWVPISVAVEKLRGFIADNHAQVTKVEGDLVRLEVAATSGETRRRRGDRPVLLAVELRFFEEHIAAPREGREQNLNRRTRIEATFRPKRSRDRRHLNILDPTKRLQSSLRAYLMAHDYNAADEATVVHTATDALQSWLAE